MQWDALGDPAWMIHIPWDCQKERYLVRDAVGLALGDPAGKVVGDSDSVGLTYSRIGCERDNVQKLIAIF